MPKLSISIVILLLSFSSVGTADEIYKWTDENGKTHYSSSPVKSNQKPAKLPNIMRENLSKRIARIKASTPKNCGKHGGIDCSQGPDKDGSAICLDGYREAVSPYRFNCLEAKLQAEPLQFLSEEGKPLEGRILTERPHVLHLSVRNVSDVPAVGVDVDFEIPELGSFPAKGPEKVEAYGIADYTFPLTVVSNLESNLRLQDTRFEVNCTNCKSVVISKTQ